MSQQHVLKVSRLEGLTDGVFAIAMTILVLDLKIPENISLNRLSVFLTSHVMQNLAIYMGSFIILGTLWIAMNFQIGFIHKLSRTYLWAHVFYLMGVCVVPFSANLLANYSESSTSILFYGLNLLWCSVIQLIILEIANYKKLTNEIFSPSMKAAILRRILLAPCFYLAGIVMARFNMRIAFVMLLMPTIIYMIPGKVDRFDNE